MPQRRSALRSTSRSRLIHGDAMSAAARTGQHDDLKLARELVIIGARAVHAGDGWTRANAAVVLAGIIARQPNSFPDRLLDSLAAEAEVNGRGTFDVLRRMIAADCARLVPTTQWIDLAPMIPEGRA
jgi:hypothetical protein